MPFYRFQGREPAAMWQKIETEERPVLDDPVLLVSLSTSVQQYRALYSHGRELAKFLLKKMEFRRFATVYSSALPPVAMISDAGVLRLSLASFYLHKGRKDIVVLAGDASPLEDQYEFCDAVLSYAKGLGIGKLVSAGTRWTEEAGLPTQSFRVKGFATDEAGVKELQEAGVEIVRDEPAPYFSSLVVALAEKHGMKGLKISIDHGEPAPHPKSVAELISVLQKMLAFKVDVSELQEEAGRMAARFEPTQGPESQAKRDGIYG